MGDWFDEAVLEDTKLMNEVRSGYGHKFQCLTVRAFYAIQDSFIPHRLQKSQNNMSYPPTNTSHGSGWHPVRKGN